MAPDFPLSFLLKDRTTVKVFALEDDCYSFHLTRLNSEKHNFIWKQKEDRIEESYETRFDHWQQEAVALFKNILQQ